MALRKVRAVRCVKVAQVKQPHSSTNTNTIARDGGGSGNIAAGGGGQFGVISWPAGEQRVGAELPVRKRVGTV